MSISSEISRLNSAKSTLKTKLNAKNDASHQIDNETLDEYGNFVDSIPTGIDTSDATATAEDILLGKTAYVNGQKITGIATLPYKKLKYIETTGTQYINIGVGANATNVKIEAKFYYTSLNNSYAYLWSTYDGTKQGLGDYLAYYQSYIQKYYLSYAWGNETSLSTVKYIADYPYTDAIKTIESTQTPTNITTVFEGQTYTTTRTATANNQNIILFRNGNASSRYAKVRLFSFKVWIDGTLVRDLIPAQRRTDNVVCLFDKVSNYYYNNQGSTALIAGPEI